MQKIRLFHWFVLEIWLIKKSCNLIGCQHFGPYLRNNKFPKQCICAGTQQIKPVFIIEQKFSKNQWPDFSVSSKNPVFGTFLVHFPILRQNNFFQKVWLCHAQLQMGFWHHAKIQNKLMIQFQETPGQTEGQTEEQKDLFYWTVQATAGGPTHNTDY